ncbi:MAG: FAD-dependent oxidoreductase, partial [Candidatus Nanohaloarchaea archaeon]|nr:FAD-dependent oxidoreductase [Candidatus Nanohaloarchaea archaeon]
RVKQFQLELKDAQWEFKPGQHTVIHFEKDGEEVSRPYTPTDLPGTEKFVLAIKRYKDGIASTFMHDRQPGDTIEVSEPSGNLYLRDLEKNAVFVSTGTGITPMVAMLKQYLKEGSGNAWFFFGERTQEDLMYRETLDQLEAEHENLKVVYSLSDEEWGGPEGFVQEHLEDFLESFEDKHFYVCGVPQMVVDTLDLLEERGVEEDRIFSEGWEKDAVGD